MATSANAHVTPAVLRWARESVGYAVEEAAGKIGVGAEKLERAEKGEELLTLLQAEKAARVYARPVSVLFLPHPPNEEPKEAQFKALLGAPEPPWPPQMHVLVRRVRQKQSAAKKLYDLLDETSLWKEAVPELGGDRGELSRVVRGMLGIELAEQTSWRDSAGYTPLRHWIDAVEAMGVLVMQDGTLPLELMRGFASTHPIAPAIVVNTQDDPRARAFSVIHELGHLCLAAIGAPAGPETETWCERFAGEVIMPREGLKTVFATLSAGDALGRMDELARVFGVTPNAAAVRASESRLVSKSVARDTIERVRARGEHGQRSSGGNYYRTQIGKLGPSFMRLVFSALDGQALTYPAASSLLGVRVNNFEKLRVHLDHRSNMP